MIVTASIATKVVIVVTHCLIVVCVDCMLLVKKQFGRSNAKTSGCDSNERANVLEYSLAS